MNQHKLSGSTKFWAFAVLAGFMHASPVQAQGYPNRAIRLVVPVAAGGLADTMARLTSEFLGERLKVPVTVENKAGGGYIIGTETVVRAPADGYTLLHTTPGGLDIMPSPAKLPYDPDKDLIPIAKLASAPAVIAVPTRLNINSVAEFIALAKAQPGKLTFASSGIANVTHFAGELFRLRTGISMLHVPYKGSAAGISDAIAGRIDMVFVGTTNIVSHMNAGTMRPIAIMTRKRASNLPNVPTTPELGYTDMIVDSWLAVFAPAGTPQDIVRKLAKERRKMRCEIW